MTADMARSAAEPIYIPLDRIHIGERLRSIDPDYVAFLAASIAERGLLQAIRVREADAEGLYRLTAGAHRLAAAKQLGWIEIEAVVETVDDVEARLREIDENLFRRELSDLDRAAHLAERKALYEALHPATKHGGARRAKQVDKTDDLIARFTAEVAEKLRISERSVQRAIARHANIAPDVRARIATSWLATKGSALDALARLAPEEQRAVVARLLSDDPGRPTSIPTALALVRGTVAGPRSDEDDELAALMRAWRRAGARARDRFVDFLVAEGAAKAPGAKR